MPTSLIGQVTKAGVMRKTVTVSVDRMTRHERTHKLIRRTTKYLTHDPNDVLRVEDVVRITSCPKKSRRKHFELEAVINRGWEGKQFDEQHPSKAAPLLTSAKEIKELLKARDALLKVATEKESNPSTSRAAAPVSNPQIHNQEPDSTPHSSSL